MHNLGTMTELHQTNSSYPGCWAYPDMLQVGVGDGLSFEETRSHFGSWAIVSSPLILSHDVNDDGVNNKIWDIISNREVLAVDQAYFGDSGGIYDVSDDNITLEHGKYKTEVPVYQYFSKPVGVNKVAVLLMNSDEKQRVLSAIISDIPGFDADGMEGDKEYSVRDLWAHEDLGTIQDFISVAVNSHDASFLLIEEKRSSYTRIASKG